MSKKIRNILVVFCTIKSALHLIADYHSGFQGDELLHIATGNHLAFGYMEFPPMIGLLAFFQNLLHSDAVFVYHILPHIAAVVIIIYLVKIVVEFGGRETAVFLTLLAFLIAPGLYRSEQLFQPVVFSQLFWVLGFYQLVRFIKTLQNKNLWFLTLFCVLGFLTKYDTVFFIFGISVLFLFKRTRNVLVQQQYWMNILVFLGCIAPNIIWQYQHHFPVLQMLARLNETQLDALTKSAIVKDIFLSMNPLTSVLMLIPSMAYFLKSKNRVLHQIGLSVALSFLFLLLKNGKAYYFFPMLLTLLPFGGLFWEQYLLKSKKWVVYPLSIVLFLGVVLIPFGMPVYSFNQYLKKIYPIELKLGRQQIKAGKFTVSYGEYYSAEKWKKALSALKIVYDSLPKTEQQDCLIWGKHYAQAGIVQLEKNNYRLPDAFSLHGSFYSWLPSGKMPTTVLALSYDVGGFFNDFFEDVMLVKSIYNPYADDEEQLYQHIYICKKPKQNFTQLKNAFRHRIFE